MSNPAILIVEDEEIVSVDIANKLRKLGYEIAGSTGTGEEAIDIARRQRPSLVLMDIRLAGAMDGMTAAEEIRKDYQIPVVFLTAHSDKATIQRAKQAEAFGYILKPFDDRELHTQIEMALYKHSVEQRLRESQARLATFTAATEYDMLRKDGTRIIVEAHGRPLSPGRRTTAIRDITEQKNREQRLQKLNRTLKALSHSSDAMMRATEEAAYLQEICKNIVEDCGHTMAWIGYAENDAGKFVRPKASAGLKPVISRR